MKELLKFIEQEDYEGVRYCIARGADINGKVPDSDRALLEWAASTVSVSIGMLKFLLDSGAKIPLVEAGGCDLLTHTVYGRGGIGDESLIPLLNLLIEHGARATSISSYGESAIKVASNNGRFDAVPILLTAGADRNQLEWTTLMYAVTLGTVEDVKALLARNPDLHAKDCWGRTPWLLSLQTGDLEKARLLLAAGSDRNDCGHCQYTPLMYAIESGKPEVLEWLIEIGFDVNATDEFARTPLILASEYGDADSVTALLLAGADPKIRSDANDTAIKVATSLEVVRMLVAAGEEWSDISDEMRVLLTGVGGEALQATKKEYEKGKYPEFGASNPQKMDIPFWRAMIHSGATAYHARLHFDGKRIYSDDLVWCYTRFGRSITKLQDGRIVEIAGEHEDYNDPDFCIYNDVVVYDGKGNFTIYGYPKDIFPPTDFHSATLVGDSIFLIGNLGYWEERQYGETPVYRLDCNTFKVTAVKTSGEKPGWIYEHRTRYEALDHLIVTGGKVITREHGKEESVENTATYVLDLKNIRWHRQE